MDIIIINNYNKSDTLIDPLVELYSIIAGDNMNGVFTGQLINNRRNGFGVKEKIWSNNIVNIVATQQQQLRRGEAGGREGG